MLIFVSAYWLVMTPGKVRQTYAQTENFQQDEVDIAVSEPEGSVLAASTENCAFGDERAEKIDAFFEGHKAPLSGQGCHFVREGEVNDVNPNLVAAIAMCESTGGKFTPKISGESYNAWGWAMYDSKEATLAEQGYNCDSWEHCIGRVTRGIASKTKSRGLTLAPEDIVTWYTPASVAKGGGDPEKAPWTTCVKGFMDKIAATDISTN